MKKFFLSSLICMLSMLQMNAQTIVVGDMNNDGNLSVGDVANLVAAVKGDKAIQTISLATEAKTVDNTEVVGTWTSNSGSLTLNADGTTTLGTNYTYQYRPMLGHLIIFDANKKAVRAYQVLLTDPNYLLLNQMGGSGIAYYYKGGQASSLTLSQTSISGVKGKTYQLTATITPSDAAIKDIAWSSSNTAVATVSSTGLVTIKGGGTATITAAAKDGSGKKATCTVSAPIEVSSITLDKTSLSLILNGSYTLTATVAPTNAANKAVTWSSSNSDVVYVSSTGKVMGVDYGTATITCEAKDGSGVKATCTVNVIVAVKTITLSKTTAEVTEGKTLALTATIAPTNAGNKSLTWTSSNTSVATVSSTGVVTGIKAGTATITATAKDGSGVKATCTMKVNSAALLAGKFTVGENKQVQFTKGNLYWDGSAYKFEATQTDYPTEWGENAAAGKHVGHFFWTTTASASYAQDYSFSSVSTSDVPFFAESKGGLTVEGTSGLFALSKNEWDYLISSRSNASSLRQYGVKVGSKANCLIIAPDSFSGTLKSEYTLDEVSSLGLVCLPAAGRRNGSSFYDAESSGYYWSSTPSSDFSYDAYSLYFVSGLVYTNNYLRYNGFSLRLVRLAQ